MNVNATFYYLVLLVILAIMIGVFVYAVYIYERGIKLAPLKEKKERLEEDIARGHATIGELQEQMTLLYSERLFAQRTIEEAKKEREWLAANSDKIVDLRRQIANEQNELKNCIDKKNKYEDGLMKIKAEVQELSGKGEALRLELIRLEENINDRKHKISSIGAEINSLKSELNLVRQDYRKSLEEKTLKDREINGLNSKISTLENQKKNLENELSELANKTTKLKEIKESIDQLEQVLTQKKIEERELDRTLGLKQVDLNDGKGCWEDLEKKVIITSNKDIIINDEQEDSWLNNFKDNLNRHGILFNERMTNAFHTGLKVADYSPLVVLSGISGTGKSLLPRLYAKALGMNFLQIAVQPRWDSPQDMFGFYNYMEGRFKATELSRMLWQFDVYNNSVARKNYGDILPMNIVLLDEMNLARVEYYFSDMLSKLEVRRGINVEDYNKRSNAEIELESGATNKSVKSRKLFVGSHNLFVGTMNEDESTQTLSDKVMDRSNVIRFGKPSELNATPNIEGFLNQYDDITMPLLTWERDWISRDYNDNINKELTNTMSRINESLSLIGRPFAHRLWQAMKEYVNNYPDRSEQGIRYAIADQIEMKILPKLNGIEKDNSLAKQVLNTVAEEIEQLGDQQLLTTFEDAKNDNNNIFFNWHGVMR